MSHLGNVVRKLVQFRRTTEIDLGALLPAAGDHGGEETKLPAV